MKIDVLNLCLKILPSTEYCTLGYYYWLSTTERGRGKKKTGLRNRAPKTDQWKGSCLFLLLAVIKYQAAESCASFRLKAILVNLSHTKSAWWLRINNCLMDALANGQSVFLWSKFKAVHSRSTFTTFKFTLAWDQTLSIFCNLLIRFMLNPIWRYSPIFHTTDFQQQQLINYMNWEIN